MNKHVAAGILGIEVDGREWEIKMAYQRHARLLQSHLFSNEADQVEAAKTLKRIKLARDVMLDKTPPRVLLAKAPEGVARRRLFAPVRVPAVELPPSTRVLGVGLVVAAIVTTAAVRSLGHQEAKAPQVTESVVAAEPVELDSHEIAAAMLNGVGTAAYITDVTSGSDANGLLGQPHGYTSATVIHDAHGRCEDDGAGVACGATIEVFASPEDAQVRAAYIKGVTAARTDLSEVDTVVGSVLLRVTGRLGSDTRQPYAPAFLDALTEVETPAFG